MWSRKTPAIAKKLQATARPKARNQEEHENQCAVIEWFDLMAPSRYKGRLFAVPNGGKRPIKTASAMKREGQRKGVLDLHLPTARRGYNGLWIEMKAKKGYFNDDQKSWAKFLREENHRVELCRSAEEAIAVITDYMGWDCEG